METPSFQETLTTFQTRKLLVFPSYDKSSPSTSTPEENTFASNVVLILTVLMCAIIFSHLMKAITRCVLKCLSFVSSDDDSGNGNSSRPVKLPTQGINKQALKTFPVVRYSAETKIPGLETECVICLENFSTGEKIRILPKCNHGFHVKCIDKWFSCHSSCPTCRHCLLETCQKIVSCPSPPQPSSNASLPGQQTEVKISIAPLQPEGMIKIVIVS